MGKPRFGLALGLAAGVAAFAVPAAAQFTGGSVLGTQRSRPAPASQAAPPAPDPALLGMNQRLDELEIALRELTGRLETAERAATMTRQANENLGRQVDALTAELSSLRAAQQSAAPASASTASQSSGDEITAKAANAGDPPGLPSPTPAPGSAANSYSEAMTKLNAGDYRGAETAFRVYLAGTPVEPQASDARFWLGESLYVQGAYGEAAQSYVSLLRANPNAARAPDALVKLSASLRQIDQRTQACAAIAEFRKRFPKASATLKGRADAEAARSACAA